MCQKVPIRKAPIICFAITCVLACFSPQTALGQIHLDDGEHHLVDFFVDDGFILDFAVNNVPGTHLELADGGWIDGHVQTYRSSLVTVSGGFMRASIFARDVSSASVIGGSIDEFWGTHSSRSTVYGGEIRGRLLLDTDALIDVHGGSIAGALHVQQNAEIYLFGEEFFVDGNRVHAGGNLRDFASPYVNPYWLHGSVTGVLSDGTVLNNEFFIAANSSSNIFVAIPEPTFPGLCFVLLSVAGTAFRPNRRLTATS